VLTLSDLNEEQLKPALETNGAILVTAGAGSGKTRLLTKRISHLILDENVNPYNILAITFTNKATNEMKERILKICPTATEIWISTFHSMCARILRENISNLEGFNRFFTIYDTSDCDKILKKIVTGLGYDSSDAKDFGGHIDKAKNLGLDPDDYGKVISFLGNSADIIKVYALYQTELKNNNALDFDDLLIKTLELFNKCPQVLAYYQNRFKYIHIDEFQDTNVVQYKIAKLLAGKHKNIFVVGDEDQCIYGWRGANIENIVAFRSDFENVKCFKLEQNYRSTKNILSIANKLIKNNSSRIEKVLWTNNEDGNQPVLYSAYDEIKEADYVAGVVYNLINRGVEANKIAILFRLSALSRIMEEKLLSYNIPYVVTGIFKFFERAEVKNVLAYLRLLVNERDNESLKRIINFPKRGIGNASIDKIEQIALSHGISMLEVVKNVDSYDLPKALKDKLFDLKYIFNNINLEQSLSELCGDMLNKTGIKGAYNKQDEDDADRLLNIEQLMQSIKSFENLNPNSELSDYLESITLQNSVDETEDVSNSVAVSTIHAAKGLEFDYVFIIGIEEGLFPVNRAINDVMEVEEERRLMYVAITRAKKQVYLTYAKTRFIYGDRKPTLKSRFISEMDLEPKVNSNLFNPEKDMHNYEYKPHNYAKVTSENVSTNLNDVFVKKLANQKGKFDSYTVGTQVLHPKFGVGIITMSDINGQNPSVSVNFSGFGVKTLSLNFAPLQILKKKQ